MDRPLDALTWYVMDGMADGHETPALIQPHVARWIGPTSLQAIHIVLSRLHHEGLVEAADPDGHFVDHFPENPEGYWFGMTLHGRDIWDADGPLYRDE